MKYFMIMALVSITANAFATTFVVEGSIAKVVAKKKEIYVKSKEDGKKYEYYFNDKTQVLKGGVTLSFADLKEDQHVRVTADKKGKRLDPQKVEILE